MKIDISQTSIERLLRQIPAVQKALAEEDAMKRQQASNARAEVINAIARTEAEIAACDDSIAGLQSAFAEVEKAYEHAKGKLVAAKFNQQQLTANRSGLFKQLLNEHGNRVVIDGLAAIDGWHAYLGQVAREAKARHDHIVLADVEQKLATAAETRIELEQMKLEKASPAEIERKAQRMLACIDLTFSPFAKVEG